MAAGYNAALAAGLLQLQGQKDALGALSPAYDKARTDLTSTDYYTPWTTSGTSANTMLSNSLGLNGASGNTAATSAFQSSPGYTFALNQGLDAVNRKASASGLLDSGNTLMALNDYAKGMANQDYSNWQSNLTNISNQGLTAASGETGRKNTLANLDYGYGTDQAGVYTNTANNMAKSFQDGLMSDAASSAQSKSNTLGGILGGVKLAGSLLTAPMTGGTSLLGMAFQ
jgi:hypothetical protein